MLCRSIGRRVMVKVLFLPVGLVRSLLQWLLLR